MKTGLEGKTVMITGPARNIGRATALMMAEEGANLLLCTRQSLERLEEVAHECQSLGVKVVTGLCDVANDEQVRQFVKKGLAEFGHIDVLVNNATFRSQHSLLETIPEEWRRTIAVNLDGPYNTCQAVIPHMMERRWGRIVNYSGLSPYLGGGAAKAAVKLGIVGFTRGVAREYGQYGITANCIGPGSIDVERDPDLGEPSGPPTAASRRETLPVPRQGTPEEIASLVVYLSSEYAAYVTGQCYLMNGGAYFS
ncbi:MAG: SDR family oxidoreductase [Chloroflexi bacterium]|nr:SDR family oxidoreductase [Chloroflexota bacterium]